MHLTSLEALMAILVGLLGTGGIGSGGWKLVAAIIRRAQAIEGWRRDVRTGLQALADGHQALTEGQHLLTELAASHQQRLDTHDQLHAQMETRWTTPSQAPIATASSNTNRSLPPPVPPGR